MIRSMTGYGKGAAQLETRTVTVELRSINSRYLEIHARLPREYAELESEAKSYIKETIRRGRVDMTLTLESAEDAPLRVNIALVNKYVRLFHDLEDQFGIAGELSVARLLQIPGVIDIEGGSSAPPPDSVRVVFKDALQQALEALQRFRSAEGSSLAAELRQRLKALSELLGQIDARADGLLAHYQQRLAARIREMLPQGLAHDDRIAIEAALYAEKSDIREEVVRLRSHIDQFHGLLDSQDEVGKQMDFLLQEMNREANTILSKAGPAGIAQMGVQMKSEIEKLREQIQNIE